MHIGEARKIVRKDEVLRLLVARYKLREIAAMVGVHYTTLCRQVREEQFLDELKAYSKDAYEDLDAELKSTKKAISERLAEESHKALDTLVQLMEDQAVSPKVRKDCADSILDRNMESAKSRKVEEDQTRTFKIDPDALMFAAATANELRVARDAAKLIEGDVEGSVQ